MPNHTTNILKFEGKEEDVKRLLDSIRTEVKTDVEEFTRYIDFNKLIPMPESYEGLVSGSITDQAIAVYMAVERKDYTKINEMLKYPCWENAGVVTKEALIETLINEHDATVELGRKYVENYEKYGAYTWYEWCNENWGTKWNAYDQSFDEATNTIEFYTAWCGVPKLINMISEQNPDVKIHYYYSVEGYSCSTRMEFLGGDLIFEDYDEESYDDEDYE